MKRFMILAVSFSLALTPFTCFVSSAACGDKKEDAYVYKELDYEDLIKLPSEDETDPSFLPAGEKWLGYVGNEKPATFSKDRITYKLSDGVIKTNNISKNLKDIGQILSGGTVQKLSPGRIIENGGYISKSVLDSSVGEEVKNGSIIVDEAAGTAFKVVSPTDYSGIFDSDPELSKLVKPLEGNYSVIKPELHEVVKEFELKEETIKLNKANITGFALNIESHVKILPPKSLAVDNSDKKFKYLTGDNLIEIDFKDATVLKGNVGNSTISVELSGGFAVSGIDLTGKYSCMGGYEIAMSLQQECYLVATLDAEINEEIRVPIFGIDVSFGVGKVTGGIFAIIGMNGEIRLDIEAREKSACKMGVKGDTFLYVPTSFRPIFEPETPKITGDCEMNGKINGYIKFGPIVGLELFGFDLVGAGVLIGAGVTVESDDLMLDIELYASIDIYVTLIGKHINILRARPTIYKKQQPDMHGFRVSFLETYVYPGRVGGLIETEPAKAGGAYQPAVGLEYRVWIVPKTAVNSFDAANREALLSADKANTEKPLKDKIRTYPDGSFDVTNAEGEFFQEDEQICYDEDEVWIEFKSFVKNKKNETVQMTFFAGPATPVLPFTDITVTYTDLFNDYITGKVEPKRLIDWDANRLNPDEIQTELTYYKGTIYVSPFNDNGMEPGNGNKHLPYVLSGTARTDTNEKGEFDTRNPYTDENGKLNESGVIDVLAPTGKTYPYFENGESKTAEVLPPGYIGVLASLTVNEAVEDTTLYGIVPGAPDFQVTRTLDYDEDSFKKIEEGGKLVDQIECDEYIWIVNPDGKRAVTADMVQYAVSGFSTQDYRGYIDNPVTAQREGDITVTEVTDDDGNPTGTALVAQRVVLQWVWQEHPNPIKITSADHTELKAGEDSAFQVNASGFLPRFSLEGAPDRVWIDEKTGLMHITQTVEAGVYTFTVHAKEGVAVTAAKGNDPKKGNDASLPDKQTFTLTVTENPTESTTVKPSEPTAAPTTNPDARTAPKIYKDEYNTYINMEDGKDLTVAFTASGSKPIVWSLVPASGSSLPAEITVNASTGVLTAKKSVASGIYTFHVKASNDAGSFLHECTVVKAASEPPVLENRRDGYNFSMVSSKTDFTVQIKAQGSAPIVYSLEAVNERIPVPPEVTIDANTGVLSVKGGLSDGIAAGVYDFRVKAVNAAGSDLKECKLTVTAPISPIRPGTMALGKIFVNALLLIIKPLMQRTVPGQKTVNPATSIESAVKSRLTLRVDDPKDVYKNDRFFINGADYIRWDTTVTVTAATVSNASYTSGTNMTGVTHRQIGSVIEITDHSPVCDRYHYYDTSNAKNISQEEIDKFKADIEKNIKEEKNRYNNNYVSVQTVSANGMTENYFNFRVSPIDKTTATLEYGSLVSEINGQKGGAYTVDLNADTGTVIPGAYFTALQNNRKASLTFQQEGVQIAFKGAGVKNADSSALYNIGMIKASDEEGILSGIGEGFESTAYAFQHHGDLPGTATFTVTTAIAEGTKVNVYRFEGEGTFTVIEKGVTVGKDGAVVYKNGTMSQYVITTKDIDGAKTDGGNLLWLFICVFLAAVGAGVISILLVRKKKQKITVQQFKA